MVCSNHVKRKDPVAWATAPCTVKPTPEFIWDQEADDSAAFRVGRLNRFVLDHFHPMLGQFYLLLQICEIFSRSGQR